jgi:hypothetical protein
VFNLKYLKRSQIPELIASVAQANAFIDSAYNLELINLSEKVEWVNKVHAAHKNQLVEA